MAQTLDAARSRSKTSVHGRRLGIDRDEFLVGVKGIINVVTEATSATTGTNLPNHGLVSVVTAAARTWVLNDPVIGVQVELATGSTSTAAHTISCDNATIVSSQSSTFGAVVLTGGAAGVILKGLSTAVWLLTSRSGTTLNTHLSSA